MDFSRPNTSTSRQLGGCRKRNLAAPYSGLGSSMKNSWCELARAGAIGLAAVGVLGAGTLVGHAADLAVKAPAAKAAPYSWTGCYAGGFAGWGAANDWKSTDLNGLNTTGVNPFDFSLGNQATGGGTLGCNWQANSWFVLGIEGEAGYLDVEQGASPTLLTPPGFSTLSDRAKVGTGYGLIAGRVGVAFDRLLIYGKVGVAFYDTSATIVDALHPGFVAAASQSQTPYALGVGGEYAIYDHWSGKAEYVFFDHGSSFNACSQGFCFKQDPSTVQTFKIGLNYKFW
jgi:outer membrane immunogenic protein